MIRLLPASVGKHTDNHQMKADQNRTPLMVFLIAKNCKPQNPCIDLLYDVIQVRPFQYPGDLRQSVRENQ